MMKETKIVTFLFLDTDCKILILRFSIFMYNHSSSIKTVAKFKSFTNIRCRFQSEK